MKKWFTIVIVFLMIVACGCVFPLQLFRKDATYWTTSTQYIETALEKDAEAVLEQRFIAQEAYIKQIAFTVYFMGDECNLLFSLQDKDGKLIQEAPITLSQDYSSRFYYQDISKWVKKGEEYRFRIEITNVAEAQPQFVYTMEGEATAQGNQELSVNGIVYDGHAVTSYTYGEPLNYKNVLCLWMAILVLGFSAIGIVQNKTGPIEEKLEKLLEKYGPAILLLEIGFCLALVVRICFTVTVDWDEAYTWKIVTENSLWGVVEAQAIDNHPPLYFLLAKLATLLLGNHMWVFKGVSVAGMLASMLLCATLVRKKWGVKAAIPLVLVVSLGTQFVFYNINLRMYSWMVFFVFAAALFANEVVEQNQPRHWVLLCLMTLGALYTQYFAVLPLFLIYAYLMIHCICSKRLKAFIISCISVVIAYLPQLYLVYQMIVRDSAEVNAQMTASANIWELCTWCFGNNIKWSEYMPFVIFIGAIILLAVQRKMYKGSDKSFMGLAAAIFPISFVMGYFLSLNMNHFWHNRYLLAALIFVWIFIAIIYGKQNLKVWSSFCVWLVIMSLSSYTVVKAEEFETIPYVADAQQKLECVQEEEYIIYNYETYDVMYEYYLPNAEFIWIDDVDFANMEKDYVYMVSWGGRRFAPEVVEQYKIKIEYIYPFRLEKGVNGVYLCKVSFEK